MEEPFSTPPVIYARLPDRLANWLRFGMPLVVIVSTLSAASISKIFFIHMGTELPGHWTSSTVFMRVLIATELITCGLIVLHESRLFGLISCVLMMIAFAFYNISLILSGGQLCNCFGFVLTSPHAMLLVDIVLATLCLHVIVFMLRYPTPRLPGWRLARPIAICFAVLAVLSPLFARARGVISPSNAGIAVAADAESFDFGRITPATASQTHTFRLTNLSEESVQIGRVGTSCGCTVVEKLPDQIATKATIEVPVQISWAHKNGPASESIDVDISQHDRHATIRFTVSGNIAIQVRVSAERLDFGYLDAGQNTVRHFRVGVSDHEPPLAINAIELSGSTNFSIIDASFLPGSAAFPLQGKSFDIPIRFAAHTDEAISRGQLILITDDSRAPRILVTLIGKRFSKEVKKM